MTDSGDTTNGPRPGRSVVGLLLLALVVHLVQVLRLFPDWAAVVDERPVIMVDHAIHLYHGALGSRFLRESGRTWGYDPFFMAGYPETPVWDSSSNLAIASQLAAGGGYAPRAYKLGLVLFVSLAWLGLPLGARLAGLRWDEVCGVAWLGLGVFWVGVPALFVRTGLVGFITASGLLPASLALGLAMSRRRDRRRWLAFAATAAFALFAHVTTPVMAAGGVVGFGLSHLARTRWRTLGAAGLAASVAVAVNLFWLVPLWSFRGIRDAKLFFMTSDDPWFLLGFLRDNQLDGRILLGLFVLGLLGLGFWWFEADECRGRRVATFGLAAAGLLVLLAFGGLWSVTRTMEPFRFLAPLDLLLTIPAATAVVRGLRWVARSTGGGVLGVGAVAVIGILLVAAVAATSPEFFPFAKQQGVDARPLVVGLRPEDEELVSWIRSETDDSGRILLEDQLRLFELTDPESTHWTPLLPVLLNATPRSFIGGIYQTAFIQHNQAAGFGDYTLAGRRIDEWTEPAFADYARQYNLGWVVCWSPLARFVFDQNPLAKRVGMVPRPTSPGKETMRDATQWHAINGRAGPTVATRYLAEGVNQYALYRLERPRSYFLEGKGRVVAFGLDRVELADLEADPATGYVTLSLHWLESWRSTPAHSLGPTLVSGDPVPFVRIKLDKPEPRLLLQNGGR